MSPKFTLVHSVDGYSTNVPTADLIDGKAMVALRHAVCGSNAFVESASQGLTMRESRPG